MEDNDRKDSALEQVLVRLEMLCDELVKNELLTRPLNSNERIGAEFMTLAMYLLKTNRTLESLTIEEFREFFRQCFAQGKHDNTSY